MKIQIERTGAGLLRASDAGAGLHVVATNLAELRDRAVAQAQEMAQASFDHAAAAQPSN